MCAACGAKPEGYPGRRACYDCKPGLPGRPRPCRRCGATDDYWASGLCTRCHRSAPRGPASCGDCHAWGRHRHIALCEACRGWRRKNLTVAGCGHCRRRVHLNDEGVCRLCRRQLLVVPPEERGRITILGWHQLSFADMLRSAKNPERHPVRLPKPARQRRSPARRRGVQLAFPGLPAVPRPPMRPRSCTRCGERPVKAARSDHCYECAPGGPVTPPPCRRCGSTTDYYSAGLCIRCHKYSPHRMGSCIDCFAWGATRANSWRCEGCKGWRRAHPLGPCVGCARTMAVGRFGACRFCYLDAMRHRRRGERCEFGVPGPRAHQLCFADMRRKAGRRWPRRVHVPDAPLRHYPVSHRQLVFFEMPRDLVAARRHGFAEPADPECVRFLDHHLDEHARGHGWTSSLVRRTRRGLRILLGIQDTPGARLRASEVTLLYDIGLSVDTVLTVLGVAGMLEEDRPSSFERWLEGQLVGLPPAMVDELTVCAEVLLHGSDRAPRMRPRQRKTAQAAIRSALPAVRTWVDEGHESLREIARPDVLAVLPSSGTPRVVRLGALRVVFRVLKARRLVFTNPTVRIRDGGPIGQIPMPADLTVVREVLGSNDPTVALLTALVAFHALTPGQLRTVHLTDVRDGRLHIDGRVVVLAEPVRERLRAYLDHRSRRWPRTANPHLFLHHRNAVRTTPVQSGWITSRLGGLAQAMREDRILDELHATRGDIRRLCDLFGLSVSGAERYLSALSRPELDRHDG